MLAQRCTAPRALPASSSRRTTVSVRASVGSSTGLYKEGQRVKVISPIMLYSVPKHPEGLLIENMEGDVFKDVTNFKGKVLSANLPYVVKFKTQLAGVDVKFQAHLVSFSSQSETGTSRIARRRLMCLNMSNLCMQGEEEIAAV